MRLRGRGRVVPPSEKKYVVTLELSETERNDLLSLDNRPRDIARLIGSGNSLDQTIPSLFHVLTNIREEVDTRDKVEIED